jgi:hypothetical protein
MEGMEYRVTRPRQVRYQAALRPDSIHSTPLPEHAAPCEYRVLIQRTCFCCRFPQGCIKTTIRGVNRLLSAISDATGQAATAGSEARFK